MTKLNPEEFCIGALVGFAFVVFIKWWVGITVPLCGFLWAFGGADKTSLFWRRIGVSVAITLALILSGHLWWAIILCGGAFYGVLTIGYGAPAKDGSDDGSWLGRKIFYLTNNFLWTDILTRGIIGLLISIAFLYLAFLNIWGWIFACLILTTGFPIVVLNT